MMQAFIMINILNKEGIGENWVSINDSEQALIRKDNKKNGYGFFSYAEIGQYEGSWQNGRRHGKGKMSWSSGALYEGDFKDGNRHGQGSYKWNDGSTYEG